MDNRKLVIKSYAVYGAEGHRQREALEAQISDGIFENSRVGRVREIKLDL